MALVGSVALALAFATSAQAAQRFASPTGVASASCNPTACPLNFALTNAADGDEVILEAGTYPVSSYIPATPDISVHGDTSGPMPVIDGTVVSGYPPIFMTGENSHLSYLDIRNTGDTGNAATCYAGTVDRVRLTAIGTSSIALFFRNNCTVRDSLLRATGTGAIAWSASSESNGKAGVGRNVTAIASGQNSVGLVVAYADILPGAYTLTASNSILDGPVDARAVTGSNGPGNLLISNSNFDTSEGTAITPTAIQTAAPIFVNAAAGDYREAAGSPTIDAGSSDGIGPLDLDGNTRSQGAAPDIGAFEATPPPTPTQPAGEVKSLALGAKRFRAANIGGSIARKKAAPVGTTVSYQLTVAATTGFTVDRAVKGRKSGKKCGKQTRKNRKHKKCTLYKTVKGGFSHSGVAGANSFKFSGRVGDRALKPGNYRLVAHAGTSVKTAAFKIVR